MTIWTGLTLTSALTRNPVVLKGLSFLVEISMRIWCSNDTKQIEIR